MNFNGINRIVYVIMVDYDIHDFVNWNLQDQVFRKYTENRSFVRGATNRNQDLAEWEQAVKNGQKPAEKQHRPPEKQSVRNRLRQLQEENKQNSQPKQRKKSQDRDR